VRISRGFTLVAMIGTSVLAGCQRQTDDDLRQAYERMMAQAERRSADEAARTPPPASPAAAPAEAPVTGEPAGPAPLPADPPPADQPPPAVADVTLRDVRVGEHAGFDRVVFEFDAPQLPTHEIGYVTAPIQECGTGATIPVTGERLIRVRFEGTQPAVANRDRRMQFGTLRQITLTCDSDAQVEWVLGVTAQHQYRALELGEPTRLVVDLLVE
jgi:hypothetical protein